MTGTTLFILIIVSYLLPGAILAAYAESHARRSGRGGSTGARMITGLIFTFTWLPGLLLTTAKRRLNPQAEIVEPVKFFTLGFVVGGAIVFGFLYALS